MHLSTQEFVSWHSEGVRFLLHPLCARPCAGALHVLFLLQRAFISHSFHASYEVVLKNTAHQQYQRGEENRALYDLILISVLQDRCDYFIL